MDVCLVGIGKGPTELDKALNLSLGVSVVLVLVEVEVVGVV